MLGSQAEILPPRRAREIDVDAELDRLERLASLLDAWFEIPGTSIRIGLDAIVGLIPGFGDALTFIASLYIVERLARLGLSPLTRARMVGNILIDLFTVLIFLRIIFSWMTRERGPLMAFLIQCTEPILAPLRRLLPRVGMLDFSPVVAVILLDVLRKLINVYL